jgi:hypothetical protein
MEQAAEKLDAVFGQKKNPSAKEGKSKDAPGASALS